MALGISSIGIVLAVLQVAVPQFRPIPFLANSEYNYFKFNKSGFLKGVVISLVVLAVYIFVMFFLPAFL